jgi:hypothetical protein
MRVGLALIAVAAAAAGTGCGLNQEGIPPPADQIFYPGGILVDPVDGRWLYVINSNADLRFNDGTLSAVNLDLAAADRLTTTWGPCPSINYIRPVSEKVLPFCCVDQLDENVLDCDERYYVNPMGVANPGSTVKIGSFGSAIRSQIDSADPAHRRLLVAVRGNSSITAVDAVLPPAAVPATEALVKVSCSGSATNPAPDFGGCDDAHRITEVSDPADPTTTTTTPAVLLPEEPYAMVVDPQPGHERLYVGHLRGGGLSLIDLSGFELGNLPSLIKVFPSIFPGDANGSQGVTSLTIPRFEVSAGTHYAQVFATSRYLPRAAAFAPVSFDPPGTPIDNIPNDQLFLADVGNTFVSPLAGAETRGIEAIPDGRRAFLLQRTPPALIGFDTVDRFNNTPTDVIEMCTGPTFLHSHTPAAGGPVTLFVSCFELGQVYVVDPYVPRLVSVIEVGRGPAGLAFGSEAGGRRPLAYVVGFGSNNVSVIDLDPASRTRYHVIQRIGFPSAVPR